MIDIRGILNDCSNDDYRKFLGLAALNQSHSQNFQDIFALWANDADNLDGIAIEFGAANGIDGSNTLLLREKYNWDCYLVEPNPDQFRELVENRPYDYTYNMAISDQNGTASFDMVLDEPDLSTLTGYGQNDEHSVKRTKKQTVDVQTVTLYDFIAHQNIEEVNYLSIDTEGSELDILKAFFSHPKHEEITINCMTVEHNYNPNVMRELSRLMVTNGYDLMFIDISKWDYFFAKH